MICSLLVASCSRGGRVIPRPTMAKIYADMFIADSWIVSGHTEFDRMADTTWFYKPIFNKYGYDVEDYRVSVEYYLNDPDRFSRLFMESKKIIDKEAKELQDIALKEESLQALKYRLLRRRIDITLYGDIFRQQMVRDSVDIRMDSMGRYFPVVPPVVANDTVSSIGIEVVSISVIER